MRLPLKGLIVYYNTGTEQLPAMVVGVKLNVIETVAESINLKVFTDNPNGVLMYVRNCEQGSLAGQWQWPDIEI